MHSDLRSHLFNEVFIRTISSIEIGSNECRSNGSEVC